MTAGCSRSHVQHLSGLIDTSINTLNSFSKVVIRRHLLASYQSALKSVVALYTSCVSEQKDLKYNSLR